MCEDSGVGEIAAPSSHFVVKLFFFKVLMDVSWSLGQCRTTCSAHLSRVKAARIAVGD